MIFRNVVVTILVVPLASLRPRRHALPKNQAIQIVKTPFKLIQWFWYVAPPVDIVKVNYLRDYLQQGMCSIIHLNTQYQYVLRSPFRLPSAMMRVNAHIALYGTGRVQ